MNSHFSRFVVLFHAKLLFSRYSAQKLVLLNFASAIKSTESSRISTNKYQFTFITINANSSDQATIIQRQIEKKLKFYFVSHFNSSVISSHLIWNVFSVLLNVMLAANSLHNAVCANVVDYSLHSWNKWDCAWFYCLVPYDRHNMTTVGRINSNEIRSQFSDHQNGNRTIKASSTMPYHDRDV